MEDIKNTPGSPDSAYQKIGPMSVIQETKSEHTAEELIKIVDSQYPRIASQIELAWGTRDMEKLFTSWMVDTRGNRKGFAKETMVALVALSSIHEAQFQFEDQKTWLGTFVDSQWAGDTWL